MRSLSSEKNEAKFNETEVMKKITKRIRNVHMHAIEFNFLQGVLSHCACFLLFGKYFRCFVGYVFIVFKEDIIIVTKLLEISCTRFYV